MNERLRIAFLTGCLFVIGLHLETGWQLIVDGWVGPYSEYESAPALAQPAESTDERTDEQTERLDHLARSEKAAQQRQLAAPEY